MKVVLTIDVKASDDDTPPLVAKVGLALISHALELLKERDASDYSKTAFSALGKQETLWADISWTVDVNQNAIDG